MVVQRNDNIFNMDVTDVKHWASPPGFGFVWKLSTPFDPLTYHHFPHTKRCIGAIPCASASLGQGLCTELGPNIPGGALQLNIHQSGSENCRSHPIYSLVFPCIPHQSGGYFMAILWLSPHFTNTYYSYVVETSVVGNIQQLFRTALRLQGCACKVHPKSPTESLGSTLSWDLPSPMALLACPQSICWRPATATVSTCSWDFFRAKKIRAKLQVIQTFNCAKFHDSPNSPTWPYI